MLNHVADLVRVGESQPKWWYTGMDDENVALANFDTLLDHLAGI